MLIMKTKANNFILTLSVSALFIISASLIFVSNRRAPNLTRTDAYNGFICKNSSSSIYQGWTKTNFLNLANYSLPPEGCKGPQNNLADEYYDYVVGEAGAAGVNPAFALTIWLAESGASNYCMGSTQDFGINDPTIKKNITKQLSRFLALPKSSGYLDCRKKSGWKEPMHAFLSRFRAGGCDPNNVTGTNYYNEMRNYQWQWVTGKDYCVKGSYFAISWPTDRCCP